MRVCSSSSKDRVRVCRSEERQEIPATNTVWRLHLEVSGVYNVDAGRSSLRILFFLLPKFPSCFSLTAARSLLQKLGNLTAWLEPGAIPHRLFVAPLSHRIVFAHCENLGTRRQKMMVSRQARFASIPVLGRVVVLLTMRELARIISSAWMGKMARHQLSPPTSTRAS